MWPFCDEKGRFVGIAKQKQQQRVIAHSNATNNVCDCCEHSAAAERAARARVVQPLREARDGLKPAPDFVAPDAAAAFRKQVLGAELEGERLQQLALAALSSACPQLSAGDVPGLCRSRLDAYAARCGPNAPVHRFVETVFSAVENV
jgi:uncharacterized protein (TIGR02444 family)